MRFAEHRGETERANPATNESISQISHELRTPLNAILGFGQLLTMSELDERQRGNVEQILTAGRQLLDVIDEIVDNARGDAALDSAARRERARADGYRR